LEAGRGAAQQWRERGEQDAMRRHRLLRVALGKLGERRMRHRLRLSQMQVG
jgi:hypothetical protein